MMKDHADYIKCTYNSLRQFLLAWKQTFAAGLNQRKFAIVHANGNRTYVDPSQMPGLCTLSNGKILLQPVFYPIKAEAGYVRAELLDTNFIRLYEFQDTVFKVKCPPCAEPLCDVPCMLVIASVLGDSKKLSLNDVVKLNMLEFSANTIALQLNVDDAALDSMFGWMARKCKGKRIFVYGNSGWLRRAKRCYIKNAPAIKGLLYRIGIGMPKIKVCRRRIID